jgi:DNA adenine methylase
MKKPRAPAECLNDLDDRIVSVFRCLRDPTMAAELRRRLDLTPFSRSEFEQSYDPPVDEIDAVRKTIVLSFMGHGSDSVGRGYKTGFRCKVSDSRSLPSAEWANWPEQIPAFVDRLRGVAIENRNAIEVIERFDSPSTLFYVDPPYPLHTRTANVGKHGYRHEMTDDDHRDLAKVLRSVEGMVVVSGYGCDLYDLELYPDWERHDCRTHADGAQPRTEVVWRNAVCDLNQLRLFG